MSFYNRGNLKQSLYFIFYQFLHLGHKKNRNEMCFILDHFKSKDLFFSFSCFYLIIIAQIYLQ